MIIVVFEKLRKSEPVLTILSFSLNLLFFFMWSTHSFLSSVMQSFLGRLRRNHHRQSVTTHFERFLLPLSPSLSLSLSPNISVIRVIMIICWFCSMSDIREGLMKGPENGIQKENERKKSRSENDDRFNCCSLSDVNVVWVEDQDAGLRAASWSSWWRRRRKKSWCQMPAAE